MTKKEISYCRKAGLFFLIASVFVIVNAFFGKSILETDITPVIFMLPLGILLCRVNKRTCAKWED